MNNNEVILVLGELMETCLGGQRTFRSAAERVSNSEFRRLFNIFAQQRAQFASELDAEINRLGGNPADVSSASESRGNVHTMQPRSSAEMSGDEASVIAQCHQLEEGSVNSYQEALKADLPLDVQYVVKRQYMDIKDAYDRIRILQRAA